MLYPKFISSQKDIKKQWVMASIKVTLRKKANGKGEFPIVVRITKNRKSSYLSTGQYIKERYWDAKNQRVKKSHPNSTRLNNYIAQKLAEANEKLLELETKEKLVSAQNITKEIKLDGKSNSFFELAKIYFKQLKDNAKFGRVSTEEPRVKHFKEFLKGNDIAFHEITPIKLKQFQAYLKTVRKNSDRTIVNHLIVIRTIFNLAIRENLVEHKYYPFGKGKIVIKFPQSIKIGLTSEEVKALEEFELTKPAEIHARNLWLTAFYFAGMRISDVFKLQWSDFKDGRLYYRMGKNDKVLSLKVADKANKIFEQYEEDKRSEDDFIFPELKKADLNDLEDVHRKVTTSTKTTNKHLGRIAKQIKLDKPLKTHIARHTFGSMSGDKIPIQMLQKLYRHSDITTTINYQKAFILKDADDALDAVLNS